ncbi:MAG TPA: phosphoribosylglycinamide formyltransferase [Planctomycetota bacterium]|nr:phosphoribosylglycinamide formyltransferase [Planctomycetota bacterium]
MTEKAAPRIAVLVSGGGRSLENLACEIEAGRLAAKIVLVLSNTREAYALERAARLELPTAVISHKGHATPAAFSDAVFAAIDAQNADLVVLAGFLRLLVIPPRWIGRVLNIHPSLLPAFGGKGFFGERVHQAVLERGVQFTGCTVHYVTNEYDAGPILVQRCVEVRREDDAHTLAARVFAEELLALPEAIRLHAAGKVRFEGGRVVRER